MSRSRTPPNLLKYTTLGLANDGHRYYLRMDTGDVYREEGKPPRMRLAFSNTAWNQGQRERLYPAARY